MYQDLNMCTCKFPISRLVNLHLTFVRHSYGHISYTQKPRAGRQSPTLFKRLRGVLGARNHIQLAHHKSFDKPQAANPGPSDHKSRHPKIVATK